MKPTLEQEELQLLSDNPSESCRQIHQVYPTMLYYNYSYESLVRHTRGSFYGWELAVEREEIILLTNECFSYVNTFKCNIAAAIALPGACRALL